MKNELLTSRKFCFSFLSPENMRPIEWFRPSNYHDTLGSYGSFIGTYIASELLLINLGSASDRKMVLEHTYLVESDLDPDMQYSGYEANLRVHRAIQDAPSLRYYDGTIISEDRSDNELRHYLAGPNEVVIFMNRIRDRISLVSVQKDDCA
jgi:hypothetical protein